MRDDTIICRCEEVTWGEVKAALEAGLRDPGDLRKYTRIGMGTCQGRTCERLLMRLVREYCREHGLPLPDKDIRTRTPLHAVTVEAAAGKEE